MAPSLGGLQTAVNGLHGTAAIAQHVAANEVRYPITKHTKWVFVYLFFECFERKNSLRLEFVLTV